VSLAVWLTIFAIKILLSIIVVNFVQNIAAKIKCVSRKA
jgi:hypothetical protein